MSPKILHVDGIANELEGASLYFAQPIHENQHEKSFESDSPPPIHEKENLHHQKEGDNLSTQASKQARTHASMHESKPVSVIESRQDDLIKTIRKTVRQVGKEELFVRITLDEKNDLRQIVYQFNEAYYRQGHKTSENEISRIALKFLLEDYHLNGGDSILAITQAALHA